MMKFIIELCEEDIETLKSDDYESQDNLLVDIKNEILKQYQLISN